MIGDFGHDHIDGNNDKITRLNRLEISLTSNCNHFRIQYRSLLIDIYFLNCHVKKIRFCASMIGLISYLFDLFSDMVVLVVLDIYRYGPSFVKIFQRKRHLKIVSWVLVDFV